MKLDFFDVNIYLGKPAKKTGEPVSTASELIKKMDNWSVKKALVWHIAQHDHSPVEGNQLLDQAIKGEDRLLGCWTILPPQTNEVIGDNFFNNMKQNHIFGLRAFPDHHNYMLNWIVFGSFIEEMIKHRIPLLLSIEGGGISWQGVYKLLEEFPDLTCILCDIGRWSANRYIWPLLERFPNLHVETSYLALEDSGIQTTVERFGPDRLLFGTGFPERYPEASILDLLHCPISDNDKKKIAHTNLENIISQIKL